MTLGQFREYVRSCGDLSDAARITGIGAPITMGEFRSLTHDLPDDWTIIVVKRGDEARLAVTSTIKTDLHAAYDSFDREG